MAEEEEAKEEVEEEEADAAAAVDDEDEEGAEEFGNKAANSSSDTNISGACKESAAGANFVGWRMMLRQSNNAGESFSKSSFRQRPLTSLRTRLVACTFACFYACLLASLFACS